MLNSLRTLSVFATILILSNIIVISNLATVNAAYQFSLKWGTLGSQDNQVHVPLGIVLDSSINIFVADTGNDRILKFRLANPCPTGTTQVASGVCLITKWGQLGSGQGEFESPMGIAVDPWGNVYVADVGNDRIQKFTNTGMFIKAWGTEGSGNGQFKSPVAVAVDQSGNVYVSDQGNVRIQKFTGNGNFIRSWIPPGNGNILTGIDVDSSNVYVADVVNQRILKFVNTGTFIKTWGNPGSGNGQFRNPHGVDVDSSGNVFVVDFGNHRIQKFTNDGNFITMWGSLGTADGQFQAPGDIAVVFTGIQILSERAFVADTNNNRIQVFVWKPVVGGGVILENPLSNSTATNATATNATATNATANAINTANTSKIPNYQY